MTKPSTNLNWTQFRGDVANLQQDIAEILKLASNNFNLITQTFGFVPNAQFDGEAFHARIGLLRRRRIIELSEVSHWQKEDPTEPVGIELLSLALTKVAGSLK